MLKEKLSLFVGSVTEIAEIVGAAFAPDGAAVGGVYVAEKLGAALGVRVPHADAGEQDPPAVPRVQVTPAPVVSLFTMALTRIEEPPAIAVENLFEMATERGGGATVKPKLSDLLESATDTTVIVGETLVPVARETGGWYCAVSEGVGPKVKVPHCDAGQGAEPAVRVQETPALVRSFVIVAVRFTTGPPAVCELNLGATLTVIGGVI